ncbi:oxidoreductase [Rhodoblastus sphagnicola]|uniref:Oxidoreductase n=1 Tax=Rhodoblastus sphagnicola TaxID=333368 RepID=A0A2S6N809_9HYPH|nr:zinc-binding alcohol dehydrogenase family protein [Rhodoblastus sphagnicola]MBB4197777.1 NADPH:quinone reductase-like Zn-dependent oxidoreductase [Rhodoblastus sphagnicola]PPQ30750.1 oxidoreductase [Rhodoblastus sphagnicola]
MQALVFDRTGDLSALTLAERPDPVAGPGEAVVEVMAAGLNPSDVKNVLGFFPAYTTPPRIPGRDFAGVLRQGPPELIGRKVWGTGLGLGFTQDGTHADFVKLPAAGCAPMPAKLSFAEAAACGVPYTTAYDGLVRAGVGPGKNLVVIGGNGAVGRAALALGKAMGARVVAAVRRQAQAEKLDALGYETLVLGAPDAFAALVAQKYSGGADVIFETTGAWLPAAVRACAKHGSICVIAPPGAGQLTVDFPVLDFYRRGLTLIGVNSLLHDTVACAKMLTTFAGWFDSAALPPPPRAESRPLSEGLAAYAEVKAGFSEKIVLVRAEAR